tara:strand:- start:61 stop:720 length:660 start_codon:yes stop_codon:yes gene_type:complete
MNKYNYKENYNYEDYDFYYQLDDKYYFEPWNRPSNKKLNNLLQYFNLNYSKSELFNIYLTGRFNSNQKNETWDIDLIVSYKEIKNKNYEDIYDCLLFLYDNSLKKYLLLVDIVYSDNIINLDNDFPNDILTNNITDSEDYTKNIRKCEGENILIFKKIIKKSKNDMFCQLLNEKICKQVNIKDKKLYIINYDISYNNMIKKKIKYITNGCIYNGIKLIN